MFFEELVVYYIKERKGAVSSEGDPWPHLFYLNSELTDYVYIFETNYQQVLLFLSGTYCLLDPIQLLQGYSVIESVVVYEKPKFPLINLSLLSNTQNEVEDGRKNTKYV